jgi:hypothetical protein
VKATWGLVYWPAFIITVVLMFGIPETIGLVTNTRNTLSWFAWREFGVPNSYSMPAFTAAWYFSFALYLVIVVFLGIHIWFVKLH